MNLGIYEFNITLGYEDLNLYDLYISLQYKVYININ